MSGAQGQPPEVVHRIGITGDPDRQAIEALYLEIRQLAKRYGVAIKAFRIVKVADEMDRPEEGE